jgi:hypothetical protein
MWSQLPKLKKKSLLKTLKRSKKFKPNLKAKNKQTADSVPILGALFYFNCANLLVGAVSCAIFPVAPLKFEEKSPGTFVH